MYACEENAGVLVSVYLLEFLPAVQLQIAAVCKDLPIDSVCQLCLREDEVHFSKYGSFVWQFSTPSFRAQYIFVEITLVLIKM